MDDVMLLREFRGRDEIYQFKKEQMKDLAFVRQEVRGLVGLNKQKIIQREVQRNGLW